MKALSIILLITGVSMLVVSANLTDALQSNWLFAGSFLSLRLAFMVLPKRNPTREYLKSLKA